MSKQEGETYKLRKPERKIDLDDGNGKREVVKLNGDNELEFGLAEMEIKMEAGAKAREAAGGKGGGGGGGKKGGKGGGGGGSASSGKGSGGTGW